ncbi:hypothetical protein [Kocuria sp. NPDC057446]|uniref:hypothetical protein n=1 Tax=Kocuria sp. NPDC057446 TaxID=3346137 RepID=UPI003686377D
MARRTDPEATPQFVTFQPWRIRISIAGVFLVVMTAAFMIVPEGPWLLTTGPVFFVGYTALSFAMHRSVAIRLEDHAVDIRQGWRKARIPYEQITEVVVGPRTEWWRIGRRRLDDGATGYLMGGPSVRITTAKESGVVSAEESYRVAGAIQRQREHAAAARSSDTEQAGR